MPNVVNSESILFYGSGVGIRMIEAMTLPRDCHAMHCMEETTFEFFEKLCDSLAAGKLCLFVIKYEHESCMMKFVVTLRHCCT